MLPDKILLDFSSAKVEKQYVHLKSFLKKSLGKSFVSFQRYLTRELI